MKHYSFVSQKVKMDEFSRRYLTNRFDNNFFNTNLKYYRFYIMYEFDWSDIV